MAPSTQWMERDSNPQDPKATGLQPATLPITRYPSFPGRQSVENWRPIPWVGFEPTTYRSLVGILYQLGHQGMWRTSPERSPQSERQPAREDAVDREGLEPPGPEGNWFTASGATDYALSVHRPGQRRVWLLAGQQAAKARCKNPRSLCRGGCVRSQRDTDVHRTVLVSSDLDE